MNSSVPFELSFRQAARPVPEQAGSDQEQPSLIHSPSQLPLPHRKPEVCILLLVLLL